MQAEISVGDTARPRSLSLQLVLSRAGSALGSYLSFSSFVLLSLSRLLSLPPFPIFLARSRSLPSANELRGKRDISCVYNDDSARLCFG